MQPLGKEPEPSRIWKRPQLGVCWRELSVFRPREEMWRGVLPCPHCLPSCLTPPPLPDPDRASQTLCSRGWELLGGGFPGEEVPTALLEEEGTLASPPPRLPQPSPPSPTPPFSVPVPPGPPGVPKFPLPGLHRRFTGLPSHFSATPRSPRRGWERQKGGGGETTSPPLRGESPGTLLVRIPPAPAAEAGVSRRCRRAEGRLQPGGRPARTPTTRFMQLRARNPARPRSLERARVARSHGQDPSPPSGEAETL